jgi:agmatinase
MSTENNGNILFADAEARYEDAEFVIFGVPFDGTSTHRKGSEYAPKAIRQESYNFESHILGYDIDLLTPPVMYDSGDIPELNTLDQMLKSVELSTHGVLDDDKFPIIIGGEHSLTPAAIKAYTSGKHDKLNDLAVIILDAHMDFRNQYLNLEHSHACTSRRVSELVGIENIIPLGVRSFSTEEKVDSEKLNLNYIKSFDILDKEIDTILQAILENLKPSVPIYLSLDMDVIDPAYAPGVGTPEPYGLTPLDMKKCIEILAPRMVGFDVVEVSPPYDNGNTSSLAAMLIRTVVAVVKTSQ